MSQKPDPFPSDPPAEGEIVPAQKSAADLEAFTEWANLWAGVLPTDQTDAGLGVLVRIAHAKTPDELWGTVSEDGTDQMVGKAIEVHSIEWSWYEGDDGLTPAARIKAFDLEDGVGFYPFTTARKIVTWLRQAEVLEMLPVRIEITKKKSGRGYNFYDVKPA